MEFVESFDFKEGPIRRPDDEDGVSRPDRLDEVEADTATEIE